MNCKKFSHPSTSTKMQQAYWEAKRNIRISLGNRDDDCMITNDSGLDTKIDFLQAADGTFDSLMTVLLKYNQAICNLTLAEENLGNALIEYSIRDATKAGEMMSASGKAITRSANRRTPLKNEIMKLYHEVQTFQFKATVDAFLAVAKMEKVRKSYRSGLMWMKNESKNLDPDVSRKMKTFRRIQEHVRNLKIRFDRTKLEIMQKIDLYLFSRCNLFSQTLVEYRKVFCRMSKSCAVLSKEASKKTMLCFSFQFQTLKELNSYSTMPQTCLICHMNSIQMSENTTNRNGSHSTFPTSALKCEHFQRHQKPTIPISEPCSKSKSKKDRIKVPLVSRSIEILEEKESLLVNLNDDELGNQLDTMPNTIPQIKNSHSEEKYSKDLLSLTLNTWQTDGVSKMISGSGDFKNECEKCVDLLDSVNSSPPEKDSNVLQFWSLMEDYRKKNYSPVATFSTANANSKDTTAKQCTILSSSHLDDVLIEFDPFTDNDWIRSKKFNDETC